MDALHIALLCLVAVLALASLVSTVLGNLYWPREITRVLWQADESRKAAWAQGDRAMSRCFAAAMPRAHALNRDQSGTIDGAQHTAKPFQAEMGLPGEALEERRLLAEQAEERARRQTALLEQRVAHMNGASREVVTQLDVETGEAP